MRFSGVRFSSVYSLLETSKAKWYTWIGNSDLPLLKRQALIFLSEPLLPPLEDEGNTQFSGL
jgi:hypothetical protein